MEQSVITYIVINLAVLSLLLIGGFFVIRFLQDRGKLRSSSGKRNPVTGDKRSVIAIVSGITRNLRREGEQESYYVICTYRDPDSKMTQTFTSRELKAYPGKEIIGKPVTVKVDPGDQTNYTVLIDDIL